MEHLHHLLEHLQSAGLSPREARVYLVTLSLGGSSVQAIAELAKMPRTTVYPLIESLMELGLMRVAEQEGKSLYSAESPDRVIVLVRQKAEEMASHIQRLERALPEFIALERRYDERPHVSVFEGEEGVLEVSARFEECAGDFFEIVPFEAVMKFTEHRALAAHRERLVHQQAHGRILVVADRPPLESMREMHARYAWELRYVPSIETPLKGHVSVKGNSIFCFSYDSRPIGMVIENATLAEALRRVFQLAWDGAPRDFCFPSRAGSV